MTSIPSDRDMDASCGCHLAIDQSGFADQVDHLVHDRVAGPRPLLPGGAVDVRIEGAEVHGPEPDLVDPFEHGIRAREGGALGSGSMPVGDGHLDRGAHATTGDPDAGVEVSGADHVERFERLERLGRGTRTHVTETGVLPEGDEPAVGVEVLRRRHVDDGAGLGAPHDESQGPGQRSGPGRSPAARHPPSVTTSSAADRRLDASSSRTCWTGSSLGGPPTTRCPSSRTAVWVRPPGNADRTGGRSIPNGSLGGERAPFAPVSNAANRPRRTTRRRRNRRCPTRRDGVGRRTTRGAGMRRHRGREPESRRRHGDSATTCRTGSTGRRRAPRRPSSRHRGVRRRGRHPPRRGRAEVPTRHGNHVGPRAEVGGEIDHVVVRRAWVRPHRTPTGLDAVHPQDVTAVDPESGRNHLGHGIEFDDLAEERDLVGRIPLHRSRGRLGHERRRIGPDPAGPPAGAEGLGVLQLHSIRSSSMRGPDVTGRRCPLRRNGHSAARHVR